MIEEVKCLSAKFKVIQWVRRNGNKAVHTLAKKALQIDGVQLWKEAGPPWLSDVIYEDVTS